RQLQFAAWTRQIDLWRNVAGREPPTAPPDGEPEIPRAAYGAFHTYFVRFTAAQLSVAIHGANLLKSATLGALLAEDAIAEGEALEAVCITPRFQPGEE